MDPGAGTRDRPPLSQRASSVKAAPEACLVGRSSTKQNVGGLTTREVELLGMLSEEMSNRDIAGRLHLSEKTVDHHVAAILAKVGVSNRRQAARAAPAGSRGPDTTRSQSRSGVIGLGDVGGSQAVSGQRDTVAS